MAILVNVSRGGRIPPKAVTHTPDIIENCNMFDIDSLDKSLKYMTVKNYWSLYDIQRASTGIKRYDIKFSEFTQEFRLPTEISNKMYSKRYVYYLPEQFIEYTKRKSYKNSELYNKSVDILTISQNPSLFDRNALVFIDGRFISTFDVLALEDKTAIIIDVASSNDAQGIPLTKYRDYKNNDSNVTILFVPNYKFSRCTSNRYALANTNYIVDFSRFKFGQSISENTLMLINTTGVGTVSLRRPTTKYSVDTINKRIIFSEDILNEFNDTSISDADDMISAYDFLLLNFSKLNNVVNVPANGYFKLNTKMPLPKENMLIFTVLSNGNIIFDDSLEVTLYYPNIYKLTDNIEDENKSYIVYCFYDSSIVEDEYFNQISLYEEYVDVLEKHINGSIPEILKEWYPFQYDYGIEDCNNHTDYLNIPNTLLYKIFKLHDSISTEPWAILAYLKFLTCPAEKYYVDVAKLSLKNRVRKDTSQEPIVEGTNYVFEEDHYVFAMNRRFLKKSRYDFRIWIDGFFLNKLNYHMELGLDYYYIYIPTRLVSDDSVLEIERHKLFEFHTEVEFPSLDEYVTLAIDHDLVTAYVKDIYIIDETTAEFVPESVITMKKYSKSLERWVEVPHDSFTVINSPIRIYLNDISLIGTPIKIGIRKNASMVTSEVYEKDTYSLGDYFLTESSNNSNLTNSDYRVFNNGRLLLPPQYEIDWAKTYGGTNICQTSWVLTRGDQVTMDHVPCTFRVVHYQPNIPKDGLIDVDGLNLPISLKWYDIYLNGRRLNYKNITIVSPTKFYIHDVDSTRHLIIYDRDRDNDVFYLARMEEKDIYDIHKNYTLIDKLIHAELRDTIWSQIDPIENIEEDIGEPGVFGPKVLDALNYYLWYLKYSYIHCNYNLITPEVKEKYGFYMDKLHGVMGINANVHPSGIMYKKINCNEGVETMDIEKINLDVDTQLRELTDRFAITPLHSSNHKYAIKGEFLCDPETGGTGIRHNDGTITLIDEVNRKKEHIDIFEQKLILANIGRYTIYDAQFDDSSKVKVYFRGENLLDNEILIERDESEGNIGKVAFSIDTTILQRNNDNDILSWSNHDPSVTITYYTEKDHSEVKEYTQVASRLGDRTIDVDSPVLVISSIVLNLPDNAITGDENNPLVSDGELVDVTKGVTLTDNNYENPQLEETGTPDVGDNTTEDDDCICLDDEAGEDTPGEGSGNGESSGPEDDTPKSDDPEYTDPMRCIVHSILIALKDGGLTL